jgi:hypothetical protein
MIKTHHFDLPKYGRITFRLEFETDRIAGLVEFPSMITRRRYQRLVSEWLESITRPLDPDPRPFLLASTIGGRLSSVGVEREGEVTGTWLPS